MWHPARTYVRSSAESVSPAAQGAAQGFRRLPTQSQGSLGRQEGKNGRGAWEKASMTRHATCSPSHHRDAAVWWDCHGPRGPYRPGGGWPPERRDPAPRGPGGGAQTPGRAGLAGLRSRRVGLYVTDAVSYVLPVHAIGRRGCRPRSARPARIARMAQQLTDCGARMIVTADPMGPAAMSAADGSWCGRSSRSRGARRRAVLSLLLPGAAADGPARTRQTGLVPLVAPRPTAAAGSWPLR